MSDLSDAVEARYSVQYLTNLTNPDDASAITIEPLTMNPACSDVEADFQIEVGLVFDGTDSTHIAVGVEGVITYLLSRTGRGESTTGERHSRYMARLKSLRRRILPKTTSNLVPTPEVGIGTQPPRPTFDSPRFDGITPSPPRS